MTVKLFETGVLDRDEAVKRLKVEKLFTWSYSTEKLYDLYKIEKETGRLELPEY